MIYMQGYKMQNDPQDISNAESFLHKYGIDIGFIVSGFFGALLLASKNKGQRISASIAAILAGTACANYLTPVILNMLPENIKTNGKYAVAFMMGYMGLKGLEIAIEMVVQYYASNKKINKIKKKKPKKKIS